MLFPALIAAIVVGTMALAAGLGLLVARFATVHWLQVMGQVIAAIAAGLGLILPLLIMLTAPAYEEGEATIINYARLSCGSFPDRKAAQAFYDAVQDLDYKYEYFDRDRDGRACEPNDDKYHPDEVQLLPFSSDRVVTDTLMPKPTPDFGYVSPAPTPIVR